MKKILVTGCNGQLGRAINKKYESAAEIELVNTDVAELNITSIEDTMKLIKEIKPYAIINCAAHTAVDACETDVDNAYKINALGPRNLSIAAEEVFSSSVGNLLRPRPFRSSRSYPSICRTFERKSFLSAAHPYECSVSLQHSHSPPR